MWQYVIAQSRLCNNHSNQYGVDMMHASVWFEVMDGFFYCQKHDIWEGNVTTRVVIQTENIRSLGFRDTREGEMIRGLILWSSELCLIHRLLQESIHTRPSSRIYLKLWSGRIRQLVTDESVEFEKYPVEVQDCRKVTKNFRGIYRMYPKLIKENWRMWTCNRLDLQTLGSQPVMPKNLPNHWFEGPRRCTTFPLVPSR